MKLQLLTGTESLKRLSQQDFQSAWEALHQKCPWATVFQTPIWAGLWYEVYGPVFQPVIVVAQEESGDLAGLLLLAEHRETGEIVSAGAHQAEYQTWLAQAETNDEFIVSALETVRARWPKAVLRFTFLSPRTPLGWLAQHPFWGRRHEATTVPRPLMDMGDGVSFTKSLKKSQRKVRRMSQAGPVQFQRVTETDQFTTLFDEIIELANFRLGSRHNYDQLPQDPHKKQFFVEQMKRGLLHVVELRAGGRLAAVEVATHNKNELRSGIITHSPFFAKSSPGRILRLMQGEYLAAQGVATLDMTPHGAYKELFATRYDEVTQLNLYCDSSHFWRRKLNQATRNVVKSGLRLIGQDPKDVEQLALRWRHKWQKLNLASAPGTLARMALNRWHSNCEVRVYKFDLAQARQLKPANLMRRDNLADLLQYQPTAAWQPRVSEFLHSANAGLENGCHTYTYAENGQLLHWGWLNENQATSTFEEVGQILYLPPHSAVLSSFHTQPHAQGRGLYRQALTQILRDTAHTHGVEHIFIFVHADNGPSRHVIEKVGFEYQFSLFQETRRGRARRWTTAPTEFTTPPAKASDKSVELSVKSAQNTHVSRFVVEITPAPRRPDRTTEML